MGIEKDKLFNVIKQKLPKNVLFTEEIADVLDVSYDASYRRIKGRTSLTFKEAVKLARHYKISLNELYDLPSDNSLLINKNKFQDNIDGLIHFYKELSYYTKTFHSSDRTQVVYSAKDIPFYHVKTTNLYWKFRIYVHLNFSQNNSINNKVSFYNFNPKFAAIEEANNFRETFKLTDIVDIWSDTTIDSSLYQIFYFFRTKTLRKEEALLLCDEINSIIKEIEYNVTNMNSDNLPSKKKLRYTLYYSKLLNLNHTIFFKNEIKKGVLMPYGSFSHIKIEDSNICDEMDLYLQKQLQLAKKISGETEIDRKVFFTTMYEKIDQLRNEINSKILISFL
ncbi:hypothetical protein [Tenacibaculum xiamenense]|uniref:hypothetical protein n=1 Tax=Tenacibaculum xiamenense TaxID=1261553 RepID=UPI00389363C5